VSLSAGALNVENQMSPIQTGCEAVPPDVPLWGKGELLLNYCHP
jgi:hypothetical protein